jgi:hypothetical protein
MESYLRQINAVDHERREKERYPKLPHLPSIQRFAELSSSLNELGTEQWKIIDNKRPNPIVISESQQQMINCQGRDRFSICRF